MHEMGGREKLLIMNFYMVVVTSKSTPTLKNESSYE